MLFFFLFRVYEQPLLLQPNPETLILEAHIIANPKPKVLLNIFLYKLHYLTYSLIQTSITVSYVLVGFKLIQIIIKQNKIQNFLSIILKLIGII